jgi:hypothetical protein
MQDTAGEEWFDLRLQKPMNVGPGELLPMVG